MQKLERVIVQEHEHENTTEMKQLSVWNPLDHLRLLWWILVIPRQLEAYRDIFGDKAVHNVGKWLSSTLIWLPLFIPVLALGLQTVPCTERRLLFNIYSCSPTTYPWIVVGLALIWMLTGWFGDRDDVMTGSLLSIITLCVLAIVGRSVIFGVLNGGVVGLAILLAITTVRIVADVVAGIGARSVAGVSMGLIGFDVARVIAGRTLGIVAWIVILALMSRISSNREEDWKTGHFFWLMRVTFGMLVLAYVFLIWFSFWGGWRVFA